MVTKIRKAINVVTTVTTCTTLFLYACEEVYRLLCFPIWLSRASAETVTVVTKGLTV